MNSLTMTLLLCAVSLRGIAAGIVVQKVSGDVQVRQGVTESWSALKAGTVLGPEASIRTGEKGSVQVDAGGKVLRIPGSVIVDLSDVRDLSQEDLLLKLTMQKVRISPDTRPGDRSDMPNATVVHGADGASGRPLEENNGRTGELLMRGARVLFDNGYYSTCALRTLDVVRLYPALRTFETGWMAAESLERSGLAGEAVSAYNELMVLASAPEQQAQVRARIAALRRGE